MAQMGPNHHPTLVREAKPWGFVAFWRGQTVRSVDGSTRYFISEHEAWMFLWLCDMFGATPATVPGPTPPGGAFG